MKMFGLLAPALPFERLHMHTAKVCPVGFCTAARSREDSCLRQISQGFGHPRPIVKKKTASPKTLGMLPMGLPQRSHFQNRMIRGN